MTKESIHTGDLILSEPFMTDPNFERTVILICSEDEEGHVGFVLNKPIKTVSLTDVIESAVVKDFKLYMGGPVEQNLLQFVHNMGHRLEGSLEIEEGLYWGGNFEQLQGMLAADEIEEESIRFFVGYSGWGEGQLAEEMEENSWIVARGMAKSALQHPDEMWKSVLKKMGGKYRLMANYPIDPRLN